MGYLERLGCRIGVSSGEETSEYVCRGCGAGFEERYHVCPECGGFSVRRREWDSLE